MSNAFEMKELNARPPKTETESYPVTPVALIDDANDGVMTTWTIVNSLLTFILGSLLIWTPSFLLLAGATSAGTGSVRAFLTPLEAFLAKQLGFYLYAVTAGLIMNIPSVAPIEQKQQGVPHHPFLIPLAAASAISAFSAYNTDDVGALSTLVFLSNGIAGAFGLWAVVFAGSSYVSRKTGADKRTSRFLFGNKSAASSQKKKWKESHKAS